MIESRSGSRFLLEAEHSELVIGQFGWKQLESDLAAQARVFCKVDLAHPTFAEKLEDLIWTDLAHCNLSKTYTTSDQVFNMIVEFQTPGPELRLSFRLVVGY